MNKMNKIFALPLLAIGLASLPALAQDHPDQDHAQSQDRHDNGTYRQHSEWKKGSRVSHDDWGRGDKVDYRANHLRQPPAGHEWRKIDGNYVLANQDGTIVETRRAH
jgi:Ni/Co efflux regulator RcnB